jgi:hypothetical protein
MEAIVVAFILMGFEWIFKPRLHFSRGHLYLLYGNITMRKFIKIY